MRWRVVRRGHIGNNSQPKSRLLHATKHQDPAQPPTAVEQTRVDVLAQPPVYLGVREAHVSAALEEVEVPGAGASA